MKRDSFQLITNVGVVLALVVLIYEVNQANLHTRAQLADSSFNMGYSQITSIMGENPSAVIAKAVEEPKSLTLSERVVIDAYHQTIYVDLEHRYVLAQMGIFDDTWTISAKSYAQQLAYPAGRIWWTRKRGTSPPDLRDVIDEAINLSNNFIERIQPYEID